MKIARVNAKLAEQNARHSAPCARRAYVAGAAVLSFVILSGCVGPNFRRPAPPRVDRYTRGTLQDTASAPGATGTAQRFLADAPVPRNWWTLFESEELDALVEDALRANPEVLSAQAALRQASENTAAQRGSYFPFVQGSVDAARNRDPTGVLQPNLASGVPLYNLFTPQVTVTYVPDVFGVNRRQVESLAAQADAQRFQLDATYLTLTANVVNAAIQDAALRAQMTATRRVIALERESLEVLKRELELGAVAEADIYALDAAEAQLESTLPPLSRQLEMTRDQLAVLTGRLPSAYRPLALELDQLTLPRDLPLGLPSQLVDRRPDVRVAEAQLHAATANVGVAIANLLPQFTITGDVGSTAAVIGELFRAGTGFWSVGANATQTLLDGGTAYHHVRAAYAALDQAGEDYKTAVLTAFQNVADSLHALDADADALSATSRAESAAQKSLAVARRQLDLGAVSYVALLIGEQTYQQAVISSIQARASRLQDTAALFQALGGSISP